VKATLRHRAQAALRTLAKEHSSTPRLSAAVGMGAMVGTSPFFGLHAPIAILLSRVLRLNSIAATLGTQVSLPFLAPFLIFASVQIGHLLLSGHWLDLSVGSLDVAGAQAFMTAWLLGSLVLGSVLGGVTFLVTRSVLGRMRGRPKSDASWTGRSRGNGLGYELFFFALRILGRPVAYLILIPVTAWFFLFARSGRRASQLFFLRVRGPASWWQRQKDTWAHFYTFAQTLSDRLEMMSRGPAAFEFGHNQSYNLEDTLAQGKGLILLSAHFGSWGLAGSPLGEKAALNIVVYDNEAEGVRRFFSRHKHKVPPKVIAQNSGPTASMDILRALRNGEIVAMLADRVAPQGASVRVPFMGAEVDFPVGPFQLAVISGAPVALSFGYKASSRRHELVVLPPRVFKAAQRKDRATQVAEGARWFASALEAEVRAHPHQWFNFYDYWGRSEATVPPIEDNEEHAAA